MLSKFSVTDLKEIESTLPQLDDVVTVENCFYYLSLLEQFNEMLTKFKHHLDAFHVRAELRYIQWVETTDRRTGKTVVPPLDVAYFLHAHLLSPHRYYEDHHRLQSKSPLTDLPLKELHQCRLNGGQPDRVSQSYWKYCSSVTSVEPYQLEVKYFATPELQTYYFPKPCSQCQSRLTMTWEEFGKWRADPKLEYKCWSCTKTVSFHDLAIQELTNDIKTHGKSITGDFAYIRGTLLDKNGQLKSVFDPDVIAQVKEKQRQEALMAQMAPPKSKNIFKRLSISNSNNNNKKLTEKPDNPVVSAEDELIMEGVKANAMLRKIMTDFVSHYTVCTSKNMKEVGQFFLDWIINEQDGKYTDKQIEQKKTKLRELIFLMEQHYNHNPSMFSLDLVTEVKRQCLIANHFVQNTWRFPTDVILGIRQYKDFLGAMKDIPYGVCQPVSRAVHLAWHVHMMHPARYHAFTTHHLGKLIEHDDQFSYDDDDDDHHHHDQGKLASENHHHLQQRITNQTMQIKLRPSRERPPQDFELSETDYRHGSIDVSTLDETHGTLPSLGDTSENFDWLPYFKDPDVKRALQYGYYSPSSQTGDKILVTKPIPEKKEQDWHSKPNRKNKVWNPVTHNWNRTYGVNGKTTTTFTSSGRTSGTSSSSGGGGGGGYNTYTSYNSFGYGYSDGGGYSTSSCGGGGYSSCGGGGGSSSCGGGGSSGCGGGGGSSGCGGC